MRVTRTSPAGLQISTRTTISGWTFALIILGIYTNIGISVAGRYIPGLLTYLAICLLFMKIGIRSKLSISTLAFLLSSMLLLNIAATNSYNISDIERIFSMGLITLSVISFATIVASLEKISAYEVQRLHRTFLWLTVILLIGSFLEVVGILKPLSDVVRNTIYANSFIYDSIARDLRDFGMQRPNLFTQEPSHLAKMVGLSSYSIFALRPSHKSFWLSMAGFALGIFLIRSATLLAPLLITLVLAMIHATRAHRAAPLLSCVFAATFIVMALNLTTIARFIPGSRAALIAGGGDMSAIERILAPARIVARSFNENLLFGFGIGTKEALVGITADVYSTFPNYNFFRLFSNRDVGFGWYNALAEGVATLGLIGFFTLWILLIATFGIRRVLLFYSPSLLFSLWIPVFRPRGLGCTLDYMPVFSQ
jgi:hypothetical protein